MVLPCSGEISHSMIHKELYGNAPGPGDDASLRGMSAEIDLTIPDAESEFYCYEKPPSFSMAITTDNVTIRYTYDSGDTWTSVNNPGSATLVWGLKCSKGMQELMLCNYNSVATSPAISVNAASTWASANQSVTSHFGIAVPWAGGYWYYTGLSGTHKVARATMGVNSFTLLNAPTSVRGVATADLNYVFVGIGQTVGINWSNDNGTTWNASTGTNIGFMEDICCTATGQYVYTVKANSFFRSTNYGSSFTENSTTFSGKSTLAVSTDSTGEYVLVKSATSVHVSSDFGATFADRTSVIPGGILTVVTPNCRGVSFSGQIMLTPGGINKLNVSTDYGVTWSIVTSPVNGDAYCIDESPPLSTSPPVADFYAYDTTPIINTDVPFKDVSTNTPTSWAWVFTPNTITYKSGSSSTSQDPTVEFDAAGLYTVQLTATNAYGSDAEIKTNYINASVYTAPPDADFHATNTTPDVGVEIQFIDDSTNTPTSWEWLIYPETSGDWTWTTDNAAQNPFITFNDSGYYTIKLTATNAGGSDVAIKTNYIHVGNDLMTNIVSYWKFANSGLIDSHGTNDGIGENMAGNPIGIIDQAIHFNGTSALVKLPCVDPLPDTCGKFEYNDFSISIWFNMDTYPEAGGAFYSMFSKWSSTGSEYSDYAVIVFKYSNGDMGIEFQVNGSAGGDQDVTWVAGSMSLTWNHLVVVKNGTSLKIYFNGELKETDICSATLIFSSAAPRMGVVQQYVGVAPYGFFDGALDEIGFWSRGLTAAEVTLLYNSGAGYQYPFT